MPGYGTVGTVIGWPFAVGTRRELDSRACVKDIMVFLEFLKIDIIRKFGSVSPLYHKKHECPSAVLSGLETKGRDNTPVFA